LLELLKVEPNELEIFIKMANLIEITTLTIKKLKIYILYIKVNFANFSHFEVWGVLVPWSIPN